MNFFKTNIAYQKFVLLLLIGILIISIFLRCFKLLDVSLEFDETSRFFVAKQSIPDIIYIAKTSSFSSPLYNILLHFWYYLGDSEFIIRLFPLIFGLTSIIIFFLAVKKLYSGTFDDNKRGTYLALLATLFLAISPMHIYYSQDGGGPYTFYFLLVLISFYLFWYIIENYYQRPFKYFLSLALLLSFSFYLHYSTIHIILALNLIFIFYYSFFIERHSTITKWIRGLKKWVFSQLILLATIIPILPMVFWQASRGQPGPVVTISSLKEVFFAFIFGQWVVPRETLLGIIFLLLFTLFLLLIFRPRVNKDFKKDLLVFLCLIVPILIGFLMGLKTHAFRPRYSFPFLVFYIILLARGISFIKFKLIKIVLILFVIFVSLFSLNQYYFKQPYWEKQPWREAVALVAENSRPGDMIIFPVANEQLVFDYYYRNYYPQLERHGMIRDLDFPRGKGLIFSFGDMSAEELITQFEDLTREAPRVWVITARANIGPKDTKGIAHILLDYMTSNKKYNYVIAKRVGGTLHIFLIEKEPISYKK